MERKLFAQTWQLDNTAEVSIRGAQTFNLRVCPKIVATKHWDQCSCPQCCRGSYMYMLWVVWDLIDTKQNSSQACWHPKWDVQDLILKTSLVIIIDFKTVRSLQKTRNCMIEIMAMLNYSFCYIANDPEIDINRWIILLFCLILFGHDHIFMSVNLS